MYASKDYKDGPQLTYRGKQYDSPLDILMVLDEEPIFEILSNEPEDMIRAASVLYKAMTDEHLATEMSWYGEYTWHNMYHDIFAEIRRSGIMPNFIAYMQWLTHGKFEPSHATEGEYALARSLDRRQSFYYWLCDREFDGIKYHSYRKYFRNAPLHIKRSQDFIEYDEYILQTWNPDAENMKKDFLDIFRKVWDEYEQDVHSAERSGPLHDSSSVETGDQEKCQVRDSE